MQMKLKEDTEEWYVITEGGRAKTGIRKDRSDIDPYGESSRTDRCFTVYTNDERSFQSFGWATEAVETPAEGYEEYARFLDYSKRRFTVHVVEVPRCIYGIERPYNLLTNLTPS